MASNSKKTLTTAVEVDTDKAQRNLRKLGEQAEDTGRDLDRASDDTEKLEKASKDAAVDVDKLADELRNTAKTTKNFADDTEKAGNRIEDTYDTVESGAMGTASGIGEAFGEGGGLQSGLGSATEAIESFAEMFGPAGLLVSFIGGAAIGALTNFLGKAEEVSEAVKARANDLADALLEAGGKLDQAYADEQVFEFIKANGRAFDVIAELEGGMDDLSAAYSGNRMAGERLLANLQDQYDQDRKNIELLRNKASSTEGLTDTEYRNLQTLERRTDATKDAIGALRDEQGAFSVANDAIDRNSTYLDRNADRQDEAAAAANRNADAQARVARNAYDANAALRQGGIGGRATSTSGRAAGGPVEAGVPVTVGEYGKELFVPDSDGQIISAPDLRRGVGGGMTVVLNVTSNDPQRIAGQTAAALRRHAFRNGAL